jgi:RNA recognition motif-containing protein
MSVSDSCRLYVGKLDYSITETELKELFSPFGEIIDVHLMIDSATDQSRGFAFVSFRSRDYGLNAIEQMDGVGVNGRPLRVNEAHPRQPPLPRSL